MTMVGERRGNTHLIGREVRFSDRIRWVRISERDEQNSVTAKWWPAVVYESYGELQKDINPKHNSLRAKVLVKRKKQEMSGKSSTPIAFLLGFDRAVLVEIDVADLSLRSTTPQVQSHPNVITPHAKRSFLFQPSSPILQSLELSRKILDFYITYDEITDSSGQPQRIDSKDCITNQPVLPQTTKNKFSQAVDFALHALDTEIHTDGIDTPAKCHTSVVSNQPSPAPKETSKKKGKVSRKKTNSTCSSKPESPITVERIPSSEVAETPIQPQDPWPTAWTKMKSLGWSYMHPSAMGRSCYLPPGKTEPKGTENVDYFTNQSAVKDFVRYKYNWVGDDQDISEEVTPPNNRRNKVSNAGNVSRSSNDSCSGANAHLTFVRGTPIVSEDPWTTVWDKLRYSGWTWETGSGLIDYYYFPPGKSERTGTVGVDYFTSEEAVKDFVREQFNWIGDRESTRKRGRGRSQKQDFEADKKRKKKRSASSKGNIVESKKRKKRNRVTLDSIDLSNRQERIQSREVKKESKLPFEVDVMTSLEVSEKKTKHKSSSKKKSFEKEGLKSKNKSISKTPHNNRIWGKETKVTETKQKKIANRKVSLTPQDKMTLPQDPSKPNFSSSSETSEDSFTKYCWKNLWADLKMEGWTVKSATKYCKLHDFYYMKPNCDPALPEFEYGRDYFQCSTEVIQYIRKIDMEKKTGNKRGNKRGTLDSISCQAVNGLHNHDSSRRNVVISEFDEEAAVESSVIEESIYSPKNSSPCTPSSSMVSESECWWLYEYIPTARKAFTILLKLGFKYTGGMYHMPVAQGNKTFPDVRDLAKALSAEGIPNLVSEDGKSNLNKSDEETLLKWVSVAHLPTGINSINSLTMLSRVPILSDFEAWNILNQKLRYSFEEGTYFLPSKSKKTFQSLEELKNHIRGHGLRVDRKLQKSMRKNLELLGIILWASLLPIPKHEMNAQLNCYEKKNNISTNIQSKVNKNDTASVQLHNNTKDKKKTVALPSQDECNVHAEHVPENECDKHMKEPQAIEKKLVLATSEKLNPETSTKDEKKKIKSVSHAESLSAKNLTVTFDSDSQMDELSSLEKHRNSNLSESSAQSEEDEVYHDSSQIKNTPNVGMEEKNDVDESLVSHLTVSYEDALEVLKEEERKNDLPCQTSILEDAGDTDKMKNQLDSSDKKNDGMQGHSFFFTQPLQDDKDVCDGRVDNSYPWFL